MPVQLGPEPFTLAARALPSNVQFFALIEDLRFLLLLVIDLDPLFKAQENRVCALDLRQD